MPMPELANETKITVKNKVEPKPLREHVVIVHNDEEHSFEYVILVLTKTCGMTAEQALKAAMDIHKNGFAPVFRSHQELCELKATQIEAFGPDQTIVMAGGKSDGPLQVKVEEA